MELTRVLVRDTVIHFRNIYIYIYIYIYILSIVKNDMESLSITINISGSDTIIFL